MSGSGEPRLALTTEADWDDDTRALMEGSGGLNIFRALANHPKLLKRWLVFGSHVLAKSSLSERDRELAILRTGWRCGSAYEFGQHTVIGVRAGITDDEVRRLTVEALDGWSPPERALLAAVDQLVADHDLDDATWAALAEGRTTEQVMDLVFAVGQYVLVSTALRTFRVPIDDGMPGFPS